MPTVKYFIHEFAESDNFNKPAARIFVGLRISLNCPNFLFFEQCVGS